MKLFRGDSLPDRVLWSGPEDRGRTFVEHFCGTGLMAKFADGGTSALLAGHDLVDLVLKHVGYNAWAPERALAYRSPMLSFSAVRETAFQFSNRRKESDLVPCRLDAATHFVWELDIDLPAPIASGHYRFTYQADPVHVMPFINDQVRRGLEIEAITGYLHVLGSALLQAAGAVASAADPSLHCAELINVALFLQAHDLSNRDERLVSNALLRAYRDHEWLLYPKDLMPDGGGISCRFAMNRYLKVSACFRSHSG
ncbi:MAG: hypothetical protein AB7P17_15105 [Nitrospirales bacterium]